ncbi:FtsK/SpoIIIE domain-containing protein, partial [Clostridium sp. YIM B02506]|uniref:FtsK/SpoIIIE domain-containing protein n=1 Tax=Clostridium sp. YIM B02506 TaxID=2910680 RepID=UPI001EED7D9F
MFMFRLFNRNREKEEWKEVIYPPHKKLKLWGIPIRVYLLIITVLFETYLTMLFSDLFYFSSILQILLLFAYLFLIFKTFVHYKNFVRSNKEKESNIENNLRYLIHTNKLYDEESLRIERNGKIEIEKRIVRAIKLYYKEDETKVYVRVDKLGDRFTKIAPTLGENLESTLSLEIDATNSTVDYFEYVFLKHRDKRIDLSESLNNKYKKLDFIQISRSISYRLSKTPHSLIVGGTGSGKSFFILGKIVSYLSLTPQAELYIIDPKKADLSLLRFLENLEDRVATEANQIAKMLRQVVEIMEDRYKTYFNDRSAFGKDYTDFGLPPVIVIFDEFSAFLHSTDKKLSKEVLDYIFTIVMKGRQAGVIVEILMQRPSAQCRQLRTIAPKKFYMNLRLSSQFS